jgi:hypothetical protein
MQSFDGRIPPIMLPPSTVRSLLVPSGRIHPKSESDEYALLTSFPHKDDG